MEYDLIMTQALHFVAQMYQADPALDAATGLPNLPTASLLCFQALFESCSQALQYLQFSALLAYQAMKSEFKERYWRIFVWKHKEVSSPDSSRLRAAAAGVTALTVSLHC